LPEFTDSRLSGLTQSRVSLPDCKSNQAHPTDS